jgi:hypothetical protein
MMMNGGSIQPNTLGMAASTATRSTSAPGSNTGLGSTVQVTVAAGAVIVQVPEGTDSSTVSTVTDSIDDAFAALGTEILAGSAPMRTN